MKRLSRIILLLSLSSSLIGVLTLFTACSRLTPAERQEIRQETRVEKRTEDRMERRRENLKDRKDD